MKKYSIVLIIMLSMCFRAWCAKVQVEHFPSLDRVAGQINVTDVWQGIGLSQAFKGSGVLVGVVDQGIEVTHPTFLRSDGTTRFSRLWDMCEYPDGQVADNTRNIPFGTLYTTQESLMSKERMTDSPLTTHGTNVAGILCGGGWDKQYIGMAPEAEIYGADMLATTNNSLWGKNAGVQAMYDADPEVELLAFRNIFAYADSIGKPCVISFSYSGYSDATDYDYATNERIAELTSKPGHIVVASVHNLGEMKTYYSKAAGTSSIGGRISSTENVFIIHVITNSQLTLRLTDHSRTSNNRVDILLPFKHGNTEEKLSGLTWNGWSHTQKLEQLSNDSIMIYPSEDLFCGDRVGYDIYIFKGDKTFTEQLLTAELTGNGEAEMFIQNADAIAAQNYGTQYVDAEANHNVGPIGCLPSVIGVGNISYETAYGGKRYTTSSIGPNLHGLLKPDVVAPGRQIVTSFNSLSTYTPVETTEYNGNTYQWNTFNGTSAATPVVAGIIALWLEADMEVNGESTLTTEKVRQLIAETSDHHIDGLEWPNTEYGYGKINAYKGILKILNMTGVKELSDNVAESVSVTTGSGGTVTITLEEPASQPVTLNFYTPGGQMVMKSIIPAGSSSATVQLQNHGIVAIQIGKTGSRLVRLD